MPICVPARRRWVYCAQAEPTGRHAVSKPKNRCLRKELLPMKRLNGRSGFALAMLLTLMLPILAACGGAAAPVSQATTAPAAAATNPPAAAAPTAMAEKPTEAAPAAATEAASAPTAAAPAGAAGGTLKL